jgi:hypothetical protein
MGADACLAWCCLVQGGEDMATFDDGGFDAGGFE